MLNISGLGKFIFDPLVRQTAHNGVATIIYHVQYFRTRNIYLWPTGRTAHIGVEQYFIMQDILGLGKFSFDYVFVPALFQNNIGAICQVPEYNVPFVKYQRIHYNHIS